MKATQRSVVASVVVALAPCLLTSCFASSEVTRATTFEAIAPMPAFVPVQVIVPGDGSYEGKSYPGSGRAVALRIQKAARTRFPHVTLSASESRHDDRNRLRIQATIEHWEDRATNWSSKLDEVKVQLRLFEAKRLRRVLTYYAHCTWWTFVNSPPEKLLDSDFDEAVLELLPDVASRPR